MKVPKCDLPKGAEERNCELHSIAGWYLDPSVGNAPVAFGGYFRWDKKDDSVEDGFIADCWGIATIGQGLMNDKELSFVKHYSQRNYGIAYNFKKQNGIWKGKFGFSNEPIFKETFPVKALTALVDKDAFYIACGNIRRDSSPEIII
ncbi:MAG: hypothetical protein ABFQ65_01135 [Nanoarchaeota archaeon]